MIICGVSRGRRKVAKRCTLCQIEVGEAYTMPNSPSSHSQEMGDEGRLDFQSCVCMCVLRVNGQSIGYSTAFFFGECGTL